MSVFRAFWHAMVNVSFGTTCLRRDTQCVYLFSLSFKICTLINLYVYKQDVLICFFNIIFFLRILLKIRWKTWNFCKFYIIESLDFSYRNYFEWKYRCLFMKKYQIYDNILKCHIKKNVIYHTYYLKKYVLKTDYKIIWPLKF